MNGERDPREQSHYDGDMDHAPPADPVAFLRWQMGVSPDTVTGQREQDWGNLREPEATEALDRERDAYGTSFYRFPGGESGAGSVLACSSR